MYGIEIYKIFNDDKTGDLLIKYKVTESKIAPVYDNRIPDAYKVDAVDNENKIFSAEKKMLME